MSAILLADVFAQGETKSITLDDAIKLAIENNISIKREQISLEAAERAANHSWNSLLPSLSISANDDVEFSAPGNTNNNSDIQNIINIKGKIAFSLSSDFFDSIQKAKLDYEAKKIFFDEAILEISLHVKELFFSLFLAKQNLNQK